MDESELERILEQVDRTAPDSPKAVEEAERAQFLKEFIQSIVANSVWASRPISQEPSIQLIRWQVIQLPDGARHCVGYNLAWPEGRVSSPIVSIDLSTMKVITRSGRVYLLDGPPGWHPDAEHVLGIWLHAHGLQREQAVNVSDAVLGTPPESPRPEHPVDDES